MKYISPLITTAALLAGCVVIPAPYIKVTAPEIRGRVVNAATQQPVPGVTVAFEGQEHGTVRSGADGSFRLPRQHDLVLTKVFTPCPVYEYPTPRRLPGAVVLHKPGWQPRSVALAPYYSQLPLARHHGSIWHPNTWDDPVIELGNVALSE
jgi:hypothetical protein